MRCPNAVNNDPGVHHTSPIAWSMRAPARNRLVDMNSLPPDLPTCIMTSATPVLLEASNIYIYQVVFQGMQWNGDALEACHMAAAWPCVGSLIASPMAHFKVAAVPKSRDISRNSKRLYWVLAGVFISGLPFVLHQSSTIFISSS